MDLRIARHTDRLDEVIRFYRDGLGLDELGRFDNHDGYSGVFIGVPGTRAHLEFTAGGDHPPGRPHVEALTVLYLGSQDAVDAALERLAVRPIASANPYWDGVQAATILDPDGYRVVLVPAMWE